MKSEGYFLIKTGLPDKAFELREFELREPSADELVIEVQSFGLNYADVMARRGLYNDAPPLPAIVGYEVVGRVVASGSEKDKEFIGKRVVAFTRFGAYARHVVAGINACVVVGDEPAIELLALTTQGVTAYYMASYLTPIRKGDTVLVHAAAGGVGTLLIQLACLQGAVVIAKVGSSDKIQLTKDLGAMFTVNYNDEDYEKFISKNCGKIDVSYNPVGGSTFKKDMRLMEAGGRMVIFGGSELGKGKFGIFSKLNFVRKMGLVIPVTLMMSSRNILGVNMLRIADQKPDLLKTCLDEVVNLYLSGKIKPVQGKSFHHKQLPNAHELLESGRSTGKISINW